ncbi:MAG: hypothetical protein A4E69_00367 [Syntrophus sp. PtaB.Bin138]|nr:MAG: hypothetical protein A4E69_00367 [Syntrophus sp. PtaB.Bin138]
MIIQIDHIAFCTTRMDDSLRAFETLGYSIGFRETGLRDLENKKSLMNHFSGRLGMALMTLPGSIGIELLDHGHAVEGNSYILPVLEGVGPDVEKLEDSDTGSDLPFTRAMSKTLRAEFFVPKEQETGKFQCNKIIVASDDIERSADFWRRLGFKTVPVDASAVHLEFRAPLSKDSCQLILRKTGPGAKFFSLDTQGFNCIAFISTDPVKDRVKFEGLGMCPTEANPFRVNGRELLIFWVRGPCGEIVEIIGLAK